MKITFVVRAQESEYWDNDAVSEEFSVSSEADEVVVSSALGSFPYLKKLTKIAIEKRIAIRLKAETEAEAQAALDALQEDIDEDSTDEG